MRILFVISGLEMGGAEKQVVALACGLAARGFGVTLVSMIRPSFFVTELATQGVMVESLGMQRGKASIAGVTRFIDIVRRIKPDVIHAHMFHANILTRMARLLWPFSAPLINTAHNWNETEGSLWRDFAYRWTSRLQTYGTNVSPAAFELYLSKGYIDARYGSFVPNGMDFSSLRTQARGRWPLRGNFPETLKVISVGRLTEAKNHALGIEGLSKFARSRPNLNIQYDIIGVGPLQEDLERLVCSTPKNLCVSLLGVRHDVPNLMVNSDVLLLPSRWEGFPLVVLEAFGLGVPVLSTLIPGISTVLEEVGCSDFGFESESVDGLVAALSRYAGMSKEVIEQRSVRCENYVLERYDLTHVLDVWKRIYSGLVRNKTSSVRAASGS